MTLKQLKRKYLVEGFKRGYQHALNETADKVTFDPYWHDRSYELGDKFREDDYTRNMQRRNKLRMNYINSGDDEGEYENEMYQELTDYIIRHVFGNPKGSSGFNVLDGITSKSRVIKYIAKLILKATQPGEYPEAVLEEVINEVRANNSPEKMASLHRMPFDLTLVDTYERCLDNLQKWISTKL